MAADGHFEKFKHISETHCPIYSMYAHSPYFALTLTVDAYGRKLDSYFVREDIKRKNKKADFLEQITREDYTLDHNVKYFLLSFAIKFFNIVYPVYVKQRPLQKRPPQAMSMSDCIAMLLVRPSRDNNDLSFLAIIN